MKTLVIIPCYNEELNIARVIERLQKNAPEVDYLIVNDASSDSSAAILQKKHFSHINLPINLGIGGGVQSGYMYARDNGYDITVQMDGDGQHDPLYLNNIIAPVAKGELDMCIGSRFIHKEGFQTSFMRRTGIQILSFSIHILCSKKVKDVTSGFRACGPKLTAFYAEHYAQDFPEPEAIISAVMNGFKVGEVAVKMEERLGGVSSINTIRSAYYMIKVTLSLITYRLTFGRRKVS